LVGRGGWKGGKGGSDKGREEKVVEKRRKKGRVAIYKRKQVPDIGASRKRERRTVTSVREDNEE
jgi:hypothetical protein